MRALSRALDLYGDPLRLHAQGLATRRFLEESRAELAEGLSAHPDEIVVTVEDNVGAGGFGGAVLETLAGVRRGKDACARLGICLRLCTTRVP